MKFSWNWSLILLKLVIINQYQHFKNNINLYSEAAKSGGQRQTPSGQRQK